MCSGKLLKESCSLPPSFFFHHRQPKHGSLKWPCLHHRVYWLVCFCLRLWVGYSLICSWTVLAQPSEAHWSETKSSSLMAANGPTSGCAGPVFTGPPSSCCASFPVSFCISLVPFLCLCFLSLPLGSINKRMLRLVAAIRQEDGYHLSAQNIELLVPI